MPSDPSMSESSMRTETITNIPSKLVDQVRQDFEDAGAVKVVIESEADGTWKLTATYRV